MAASTGSVANSLKSALSRLEQASGAAGRRQPVGSCSKFWPYQSQWILSDSCDFFAAAPCGSQQDKTHWTSQRSLWCGTESFWRELCPGDWKWCPLVPYHAKLTDWAEYLESCQQAILAKGGGYSFHTFWEKAQHRASMRIQFEWSLKALRVSLASTIRPDSRYWWFHVMSLVVKCLTQLDIANCSWPGLTCTSQYWGLYTTAQTALCRRL